MIRTIVNNAFRILGTPVNAKIKERLANLSKIKAYAKVNKAVSFPLDLEDHLQKPERTFEMVQQAFSSINTPDTFIKNSLFWFYTMTPEQKEAAELIAKNDLASATEIYAKGSDFSSIISSSTAFFIQNQNSQAIQSLTKLIEQPEIRNEFSSFISDIVGQSINLTTDEVLNTILEALLDTFQPYDLLKIYESVYKVNNPSFFNKIEKLINQQNAEKLIKRIESSAKAMIGQVEKNCEEAYNNCEKNIKKSLTDLRFLERCIDPDSTELKNASDNFAHSVLHCIYVFHREDRDPRTLKKSLDILKKIKRYVYSEMLASDFDDNINYLLSKIYF